MCASELCIRLFVCGDVCMTYETAARRLCQRLRGSLEHGLSRRPGNRSLPPFISTAPQPSAAGYIKLCPQKDGRRGKTPEDNPHPPPLLQCYTLSSIFIMLGVGGRGQGGTREVKISSGGLR